jgi:predicted TIM-barrel fold metal-dependent hydrolase
MLTDRIISAVDHVIEPPDVWSRRLSRTEFADGIPHIEQRPSGTDFWIVDGCRLALADVASVGALMEDRAMGPAQWEEMPKAAYDPAARLQTMDQDGIECAVLYPTLAGFSGERFGAISDPDLQLACVRAYNDWLIEEWAGASARFIPQCIVPLWPIEATVKEIERAVRRGHRGVIFPGVPMHSCNLPHINGPEYDPIWATCQELDVPLCFHAGSAPKLQFPPAPNMSPQLTAAFHAVIRPASAVFDLSNLLFSRILLRFPKLKVVLAESTIGWGTFLLEYADHQYDQDHCDYELKPSEMFQRQVYLTTWYDPVAVNARHIGATHILWSTNFPAASSTWPETRSYAEKSLTGVDDADQDRILSGNAAKLYKITSRIE